MTWGPVLNLKSRAERFEQRMKVKVIIKRITDGLLKRKWIYSFELGTPGWVYFFRRELTTLLAGLTKLWFRKKCFCFYQEICFSFFINTTCKFWKDSNSIIYGKTIFLLNRARITSVTKASVSQAGDFHASNGIFCGIF